MCFVVSIATAGIYTYLKYPRISLSAFNTSLYHAHQQELAFNSTARQRYSVPENSTCFSVDQMQGTVHSIFMNTHPMASRAPMTRQ